MMIRKMAFFESIFAINKISISFCYKILRSKEFFTGIPIQIFKSFKIFQFSISKLLGNMISLRKVLLFHCCVFHWTLTLIAAQNSSPNIIFIYADDLGWNDVSFHGSPQIPTPNIDALAMSGILLNNYYGQWLCTPSRGMLMSGRDAIRIGLQHFIIRAGEMSGLPLDIVTLPQYLKKLDYSTHMIGKWHLGYQSKEYTPTYRGFDSFFGYYNGHLDHYDYSTNDDTNLPKIKSFFGIDLHNNTRDNLTTIMDFRGPYAPDVFTEKAEEIIHRHDTSKPLFLYLAQVAVHPANSFKYLQAPPKYVKQLEHIKDPYRRLHAGAVLSLDNSVDKVFQALHGKDILNNTIIIFVSDNGGETILSSGGVASNFPLRGKKSTLWEGGVRIPAFIWSPLLNLQKPRISKQMMHVTDWLPTLYKAAGGDPTEMKDIDGMDIWDALTNDKPSPREEFLYNIDPILGMSAVRVKDMKVINGSNGYDTWYNPTRADCFNGSNDCNFVNKGNVRDLLTKSGMWIVDDTDTWREEAAIMCSQPPPSDNGGNCDPGKSPCLFNITNDPCEYNNLADHYPEIVKDLMKKIDEYQKTAMAPQSKPSDPRANPECHDFTHVTWLDPEYYNECNEYN